MPCTKKEHPVINILAKNHAQEPLVFFCKATTRRICKREEKLIRTI